MPYLGRSPLGALLLPCRAVSLMFGERFRALVYNLAALGIEDSLVILIPGSVDNASQVHPYAARAVEIGPFKTLYEWPADPGVARFVPYAASYCHSRLHKHAESTY